MKFSSLEELKKRLEPALKIKEQQLKETNPSITTETIWNYLTMSKWKDSTNLSLADMVNDILKFEF